jgi:predicted phosphodiesterase
VGTGRKHHEIQKRNYRVEGRLNQPKQKGASGGIQTKDEVHTRNINVITKMPLLRGVARNRTHTTGVYGNNDRKRRKTGTTKEVWTNETEGQKKLIEYTKKIGLFHGIRVEDQELITRNYEEKNTNGQEC